MNCLDFRRRMLIDPLGDDEQLLAHERDCSDCDTFARELRAQEIRLRSVLREVKAPEGLAERIQLAAHDQQHTGARRYWWYSAAAAVLMAISVSMLSLWHTATERGDMELAQSVLNHIEDEAHHLREAQAVSSGRLKWVFRRFDAELVADIGQVNFAAECLMRQSSGVHLVMPGEHGPITVFFMPGETPDAALPVSSARFQGEILPTSWGSVAVIGERGESLQGLGRQLIAAVRWPAAAATAGSQTLLGRGPVAGVRITQQQDG